MNTACDFFIFKNKVKLIYPVHFVILLLNKN